MLVDDEIPFIETMTKRLTKREFSVISASSGADALVSIGENQKLDVVILDVKMPGMDGLETLQKIKQGFPLVEVIMLTGHATVESAIEGMKQGAFDYLMKPCDIEQLILKVNDATRKKRDHEEKISNAKINEVLIKRGW